MENPLLSINGLQTFFFTESGTVKAVDQADLQLNHGETLGLVGESGCGKSITALSIMRLVDEPGRIVGGEILFKGKDLLKLGEGEMQKIRGNEISMIFQEPMTSLNPVFTVGTQIAETIRIHKRLSKKASMEMAVEMLDMVKIPSPERRASDFPHELSGGMLQRVMIAIALSCSPNILIADEPTTALDVTIQAQILELIEDLKEKMGTSVIFITHDLGVVAETAQSVAVMYAGKVMELAGINDLFRDPVHPYTQGLIGCIPPLEAEAKSKLNIIPGIVPNLLVRQPGCRFYQRCERNLEICGQEQPKMTEVAPNHWVRCWHAAA